MINHDNFIATEEKFKQMKMKYFNILLGLVLLLTLGSCSKEVSIDTDSPLLSSYAKTYIVQAAKGVIDKRVTLLDGTDTVTINGFLGGAFSAKEDLQLNFAIAFDSVSAYNNAHGTAYEEIPADAVAIANPTAAISVGSNKSEPVDILIKKAGFLAPFTTYLLPIRMTQSTPFKNSAIPELSMVYITVTGSYAPGTVPRTKVASLGQPEETIIVNFRDKLIVREPVGNRLLVYVPDEDGLFAEEPVIIGTGWENVKHLIYFDNDRLITIKESNGELWQFPLDYHSYSFNQEGIKSIGAGWGNVTLLTTFDHYVLPVDGDNITRFPLDANGNWDWGGIGAIGTGGWAAFTSIFQYRNSLMAIEPNGDMWEYPVTMSGTLGARTKVGSGWDMYVKVIPFGVSDLLALDNNGDLWRYEFNTAGFWPLK